MSQACEVVIKRTLCNSQVVHMTSRMYWARNAAQRSEVNFRKTRCIAVESTFRHQQFLL